MVKTRSAGAVSKTAVSSKAKNTRTLSKNAAANKKVISDSSVGGAGSAPEAVNVITPHNSPPRLSPQRSVSADGRVVTSKLKNSHLMNQIPEYAGDGEVLLQNFVDKLKLIADHANWTNLDKVFVLKLKLRGQAEKLVSGIPRLKNSSDFSELISILKENFESKDDIAKRMADLVNLKQKPLETIRQYAIRIETESFLAVPDALCGSEGDNLRSALLRNAFVNGLKLEIKKLVLAQNPKTFDAAKKLAILEEDFQKEHSDLAVQGINLIETNKRQETVEGLKLLLNEKDKEIDKLQRKVQVKEVDEKREERNKGCFDEGEDDNVQWNNNSNFRSGSRRPTRQYKSLGNRDRTSNVNRRIPAGPKWEDEQNGSSLDSNFGNSRNTYQTKRGFHSFRRPFRSNRGNNFSSGKPYFNNRDDNRDYYDNYKYNNNVNRNFNQRGNNRGGNYAHQNKFNSNRGRYPHEISTVVQESSSVPNLDTLPIIAGRFAGRNIRVLVDSGSSINIVYEEALSSLDRRAYELYRKPTILRGFNGQDTIVDFKVSASVEFGNEKQLIECWVIKSPAPKKYKMILGNTFLRSGRVVLDFIQNCVKFRNSSIPFMHRVDLQTVAVISKVDSYSCPVRKRRKFNNDSAYVPYDFHNYQEIPQSFNFPQWRVVKSIKIKPQNAEIAPLFLTAPNNIPVESSVRPIAVATPSLLTYPNNIPLQKSFKAKVTASKIESNKENVVNKSKIIAKVFIKTILEPNKETFVKLKVKGQFEKNSTILLEPNDKNKIDSQIFLARAVYDAPDKGFIFAKVANPSQESICLNKGMKLGFVEEVKKIDVNMINSVSDERPIESNDKFEVWGGDFDLKHLTPQQENKLQNLLKDYSHVFAKSVKQITGCETILHKINLNSDIPVRQRSYRVPHHLQKELNKQVTELLDAKIIRPSVSPYNTPVLFVKKPDGSYRLVCDFRRLNNVTITENFPIPNIGELIDNLAGATYFSTLDLTSGFYQLSLHPDDYEKTAFSTPEGHWEWTRTPFGLKNAPASFQRLMSLVLSGISGIYIDDVIVASRSFEEHLVKLREIFDRLSQHGLKLKPSKCHFFRRSIRYLGFRVSEGKVQPDPQNLEVVKKFNVPHSIKNVRQFLGLTGFYRKFIPDYAEISLPLTNLLKTKDKKKFIWCEDAQKSFDILKEKLLCEPILVLPNFEKPFVLHTDASIHSIGAYVSQADENGFLHPISFASRKLNESETKYSTVEREALAVVWATNYYKHYLIGRHFTVYCDQHSLSFILKLKDPTSRLARWIASLFQFDYTIIHKPGKMNIVADFLSRNVGEASSSSGEKCLDKLKVKNPSKQIKKNNIVADRSEPVNVVDKPGNSSVDQVNNDTNLEQTSAEATFLVRLRNAQKSDPRCNIIKGLLEKGMNPYPQKYVFFIKDDILWCTFRTPRVRQQCLDKIVVPQELVSEVLWLNHDCPTFGHCGFRRTLASINRRFYWKDMYVQTSQYVASCEICVINRGFKNNQAPIQKFSRSDYPFQRIAMDCVGPLPVSNSKNKFILVITDYFTRWPEAYPLESITTNDILKCLEKFVSSHGIPQHIVSDRGTNFVSKAAQSFYKKLGIIKHTTTSFHPQSDGCCERLNGTLLRSLKNIAFENRDDWDLYLNFALLAHRNAVHASTGESPSYLVYGRDLSVPNTILTDFKNPTYDSVYDYGQDLQYRLKRMYELVKSNLEKAEEAQMAQQHKKAKQPVLKVDDLVYLYSPFLPQGQSKKLSSFNKGPYKIIKQTSPVNFLVRHVLNEKNEQLVHVNRLTLLPKRPENLKTYTKNRESDNNRPQESETVVNKDVPSASDNRGKSHFNSRVFKNQNSGVTNKNCDKRQRHWGYNDNRETKTPYGLRPGRQQV